MKMIVAFSAFALLLATPTLAKDHSGHATPAETGSASTDAFAAANAKMHEDMAVDFTGDADVDFIRGMIPHHQGASTWPGS